jgi:hypothetical protein
MNPKKKQNKNATEDEHVGYAPGKNPPADFSKIWHT